MKTLFKIIAALAVVLGAVMAAKAVLDEISRSERRGAKLKIFSLGKSKDDDDELEDIVDELEDEIETARDGEQSGEDDSSIELTEDDIDQLLDS